MRKELEIFCNNHGITKTNIPKNATVDDIQKNPFILKLLPFEKKDSIAEKCETSMEIRVLECAKHLLESYSKRTGNTYMLLTELCCEIDNYYTTYELKGLKKLLERNSPEKLVIFDNKVASVLYNSFEKNIKIKLTMILSEQTQNNTFDNLLRQFQDQNERLTKEQLGIIKLLESNRIVLLTGGPGTGKSTIISDLCVYMYKADMKIFITGPTGKSVTNLENMIKRNIHTDLNTKMIKFFTLHRYINYSKWTKQPQEDEWSLSKYLFEDEMYKEEPEQDYDLFVIDELSMVDIELMSNVIDILESNTNGKYIFVGDPNQLPSIGPGQVLYDLLQSGMIKQHHLSIPQRTNKQTIILNAHNIINMGTIIYDDIFHFIEKETEEEIFEVIKNIIEQNRIVQILTPINGKDGQILGTMIVNRMFKRLVNNTEIIANNKNGIGMHDRVMQVINKYKEYISPNMHKKIELIANGQCGIVVYSNDAFTVVDFDGRRIKYYHHLTDKSHQGLKNELNDNLRLAYCCTIHKSQGSEYGTVVIPVHKSMNFMLTKKILYTAITRAKEKVILVGNKSVFEKAMTKEDKPRKTTLSEF